MVTALLVIGCGLALACNLFALASERRPLAIVSKLLASTCFVLVALDSGALDQAWTRVVLLGLALGFVGDACLLGTARAAFVAGLAAFLLGHLAYASAFVLRGMSFDAWVLAGALTMLASTFVVDRWLRPHVPDALRLPVRIYMVTIAGMVALAFAAWRAGGPATIFGGALCFYASDLAVARQRFVVAELRNRLWGLPAYYLAQLLLALSLAAG